MIETFNCCLDVLTPGTTCNNHNMTGAYINAVASIIIYYIKSKLYHLLLMTKNVPIQDRNTKISHLIISTFYTNVNVYFHKNNNETNMLHLI